MVLFRYCSLGGDTAKPGGLYVGLCHAFLVSSVPSRSAYVSAVSAFLSEDRYTFYYNSCMF